MTIVNRKNTERNIYSTLCLDVNERVCFFFAHIIKTKPYGVSAQYRNIFALMVLLLLFIPSHVEWNWSSWAMQLTNSISLWFWPERNYVWLFIGVSVCVYVTRIDFPSFISTDQEISKCNKERNRPGTPSIVCLISFQELSSLIIAQVERSIWLSGTKKNTKKTWRKTTIFMHRVTSHQKQRLLSSDWSNHNKRIEKFKDE